MQTRINWWPLTFLAFSFCLSGHSKGWESSRASQPVTVVAIGDLQRLPYDISLNQSYLGYLNSAPTPLPTSELNKLAQFPPFNTDGGNANISLRINGIRSALLESINVISFDEPKAADSLYWLYGNNRLSLAFSDDVRGDSQLRDDGSGDYGDEALNFFDFPIAATPSTVLKLYDPQVFDLTKALYLEGLNSLQPRYAGAFPTTPATFAQASLLNQLAEVNIGTKLLNQLTSMSTIFGFISTSGQLPVGANGLGARIGNSILQDGSLNLAQKQDAARNLFLRVEGDYKPRTEFELQKRQFYRDGLQYFIAGQLPGASYNHFMRRTAWYDHTTKLDTGEFRFISVLAGSGHFNISPAPTLVNENFFRQIAVRADGTKAEFNYTLPSLNSISGALRFGTRFLIGGDSATSSEGILRGYFDQNNDGVLEENTGREVLRSSMFFGGYSLLKHPVTDAKYVFNRASNKLFELTGSDADGFPTGFTDRGALSTTKTDLLKAQITRGGNWAIGLSDYNIPIDKYSLAVEAHYNTATLKFDPYRVAYPFEESKVSPAIAETPVPNTTYLEGTGTPNAVLNAYRFDGANMTLIDDAKVDSNGNVAFYFINPILAGQTFIITDTTSGESSPSYLVPSSITPRFFTPRLRDFGGIQFQGFGQPSYPYNLQFGSDPAALTMNWNYNLPRSGGSFWNTTLNMDRGFVAGVVLNPVAAGQSDYYRVAPGTLAEFHPRINDRHSSGATFELSTATTLDPERFSFGVKGSFNYTALTVNGDLSFNYRIKETGQTSPPVAVVISADYPTLVNPPVIYSALLVGEFVAAPCLVIGGKNYPKYQFNCANNPSDACQQPHWHSPLSPTVYSLETPNSGITDPNPPSCGYGKVSEVAQTNALISLTDWSAFKTLHAPPISVTAPLVGGNGAKGITNEVVCAPVSPATLANRLEE